MRADQFQITVDCADPLHLAIFCAAALAFECRRAERVCAVLRAASARTVGLPSPLNGAG
jgi:hypothetical protein